MTCRSRLQRRYGHLRTVGTHDALGVRLSIRTSQDPVHPGFIVRGDVPSARDPIKVRTRHRSSAEQIVAIYRLEALGELSRREASAAIDDILLHEVS